MASNTGKLAQRGRAQELKRIQNEMRVDGVPDIPDRDAAVIEKLDDVIDDNK